MPLTDTKLRSLRQQVKPQKLSDGGGLHILVTPNGSKLWRLSYRFAGKQKTLSLGAYPTVSLLDARKRRDQAKELLNAGKDPSYENKMEKARLLFANENTFSAIADKLIEKQQAEGRATVTINKKKWILAQARPDLGHRPISEITASEVLVPLRKVEAKGNHETARRMRSTISEVFRLAIANGLAENDPTFGLKGALITPKVTHRAAFTKQDDFASLVKAVWQYSGQPETRIALQLMSLLYPRPGELRLATWDEFDLQNATWTIPAERTKMRREHIKPLSTEALSVLINLQEFTGHRALLLPSVSSARRPMSENTMNSALRRMGFTKDQVTAHGFRASASSLLNESGLWSADAIEAELGHVEANQVRRAYHRALYWDERVKMSEWWCVSVHRFAEGAQA